MLKYSAAWNLRASEVLLFYRDKYKAPHPFSGWKHRALEAGRTEVWGRGRIGGTRTLSFPCPPPPAHLPLAGQDRTVKQPFPPQ